MTPERWLAALLTLSRQQEQQGAAKFYKLI